MCNTRTVGYRGSGHVALASHCTCDLKGICSSCESMKRSRRNVQIVRDVRRVRHARPVQMQCKAPGLALPADIRRGSTGNRTRRGKH